MDGVLMSENMQDTKICPWCGEEIKKKAIICRYCFQDVTQSGYEAAERATAGAVVAEGVPSAPTVTKPQAPKPAAEPTLSRLTRFVPKNLIEGIITSADTMEEGESRPIAILFSDLSGFTSLTETLGAEQMSDLLDEIYAATREIIARYDGVVEKFIGDAVMGIFGAPIAHGDDAERAIRSAIDVRDAVCRIGKEHGFNLDTHAGVAYGEVVFKTSKEGGGLDFRSIGDAVNLASRLQGKAMDGEILTDHRIQRQTRTVFHWEDLEEITVKGKKEMVKVHKVVGVRKQFAKIALGERMELFPLVGRKKELGILAGAAEGAAKGKKEAIVLVTGDAGVGKSRLIYEFYHTIKEKNYFWHTGRCLSFGTNIPFLPFVSLVKSILNLPRDSGPPVAPDDLKERVDRIFQSSPQKGRTKEQVQLKDDIFYSLAILLSVSLEKNPILFLSPKERRKKIFEAVLLLCARIAVMSPAIFVFEDFHWADADSLDLLDNLMVELTEKSVVFLIVMRPGLEHVFPHPDKTVSIRLEELSDAESKELISEIIGTKAIPVALREIILTRTQGNPFYIEEVILDLQEKGFVEHKGKAYRLKCPIEEVTIPDTVEGVVLARIDRLERKVKQVLQCASVIGQEFRYRALVQISELNRNMQEYIYSLVSGEYILEETNLPELIYIFKHIVLRDVAYSTLLEKRRRFFHARVGRALENIYEDRIEEFVEIIAHHYERGTIYDKAAYYLERAALKCEGLYAQRAAADFWERFLVSIEKIEPPQENLNTLRLKGNLHLGELCRRLGRPQRGVTAFQTALKDAEDLGDMNSKVVTLRGLAEAFRLSGMIDKALGCIADALAIARQTRDDSLIASCHNFIGHIERMRGNYQEAKKAFEEVLAFAKATGDRQRHYQALNHLGIIYMYFGESKRADESFRKSLELATELGRKNEQVQILLNIGINHLRSGECDLAKVKFGEALSIADRIEFEQGAQLALLDLTDLALKRGDIKSASTVSKRLFERMKEAFFSDIMAMALSNQARIHLGQGNLKQAKSTMNDAYAISRADENYAAIIDALSVKTEILLAEGDNENALKAAIELLTLVTDRKDAEFLSPAQVLRARSHLALNQLEEARQWARKAVESAKRSSIPRDEAWALWTLVQCETMAKKSDPEKIKEVRILAERAQDKALLAQIK